MKLTKYILVFVVTLFVFGLLFYVWLGIDFPSLESLPQRLNQPSVRITDRTGRILYEVLPEDGGRHAVVSLDSIPLVLRQATIATEDRSFFTNPGVDLKGVLRAVWINLRGGETLSGGSTITQQVARNLLLSQDERAGRSLRRKIREGLIAWQMTRRLSKEEILGLYLNQTYYGGLAYGVEAAAQTFFGKSVRELDLAESALIAGLPQAPALYNPFTDPQAAKARQLIVLGLMENDGWITVEQHKLAAREPLIYSEMPYPIRAPHFVMMVRNQIDELYSPQEIAQYGGLSIRTTLDLDWQAHAETAITRQLQALNQSPDGIGHNVNNAALVALDPHNGEILVLVGSPDYFDAGIGGAINMAISARQPGSALKPLVYANTLDPISTTGGWTAATMLLDVSTSFITKDGKAYTPANYDLKEHGPVLLRHALASSLNIPAVIALERGDLPALFNLAGKMGITTMGDPDEYDLSIALGGGEVQLLELTEAYGAFANGGYRVQPQSILEILDFEGNTVYSPPRSTRSRVLDERVAWLISDILNDNEARRTGFGSNSILQLDRPAAVKTGTTTNFHDNWTVGYTPDLVVGVWSGNSNYEPMREVNGLTGAAPIWHQFMRAVLSGKPKLEFIRPEGLVHVEICALSGLLPSEECQYRRWEWFIQGTQPTQKDRFFREVIIDSDSGILADDFTPLNRRSRQVILDLPPQAHQWAHSEGLTIYSDLIPGGQIASSNNRISNTALQLVSPAQNSAYWLTPGFDASAQRLRLEASGISGLRDISIWVDGVVFAGFSKLPYKAWWILSPGLHEAWVEAINANGELIVSDVITFSVHTK